MPSVASLRRDYRDAVGALSFADVNAWVGEHPDPLAPSAPRLEELVAQARQAGIGELVLSRTDSLFIDPWEGNERLLGLLDAASDAALTAAICLTPDATPPDPAIRNPKSEIRNPAGVYLDTCIARGARLARLFPRSHGFSLAEWCCGELLAALEERRLPVMIRHTEAAWHDIHDLCAWHPRLPVIIDGSEQKLFYHNRVFEALLAAHPRLMLETGNLVHCLGLDALVSRFGAGRFLFGSGMPQRDPNTALAMVALAEIGDEERRQIAGANWRRLAGEVRGATGEERRDG